LRNSLIFERCRYVTNTTYEMQVVTKTPRADKRLLGVIYSQWSLAWWFNSLRKDQRPHDSNLKCRRQEFGLRNKRGSVRAEKTEPWKGGDVDEWFVRGAGKRCWPHTLTCVKACAALSWHIVGQCETSLVGGCHEYSRGVSTYKLPVDSSKFISINWVYFP